MQGFYRNHMEEVIKFFETHHKVFLLNFMDTFPYILMFFAGLAMNLSPFVVSIEFPWSHLKVVVLVWDNAKANILHILLIFLMIVKGETPCRVRQVLHPTSTLIVLILPLVVTCLQMKDVEICFA
jgi:hypothetical protein